MTADKVYSAILGQQAAIEAALLGPAVDFIVMHSPRWANISARMLSTWPFVHRVALWSRAQRFCFPGIIHDSDAYRRCWRLV
jgi:hypothetical protein